MMLITKAVNKELKQEISSETIWKFVKERWNICELVNNTYYLII